MTSMNIHEYQAKSLLKQFQVATPKGFFLETNELAYVDKILENFADDKPVIVKAQIHAGGRGKGHFIENGRHGVQCAKTKSEVYDCIASMVGQTLVTVQTGPRGKRVHNVYLEEGVQRSREFYVSIVVDREHNCPTLIAAIEGGGEIEELAQTAPEKILKVFIDSCIGLQDYQAREVAFFLQLPLKAFEEAVRTLKNLYRLFVQTDATCVEINPWVLNEQDQLLALDAKIQFDDNALFRHKDFLQLMDPKEKDDKENEADKAHLNYVALDGNIACLVNGAGLAMATMDIIKYFGGEPANFLDVGGGANAEQMQAAFKIILKDPNVRGIFINVFGGILKCDLLAESIVKAASAVQLNLPLVVRLRGTNVERAQEILQASHLPLISIHELEAAAKEIVQRVKEQL